MGNLGTLSIICILFTMLTTACGSERTNRERARTSPDGQLLSDSPEFAAVYAVMESKCMGCHAHRDWEGQSESYFTEGSFPLVVKGDLNGSTFYNKLKKVGGNMPETGDITNAQFESIKDWILAVK